MRNERYVNLTELRKAIEQIHPNGERFEVRILGEYKPIAGYFDDVEELIKKLDTVDLNEKQVYFTLNMPSQTVMARCYNTFRALKNTTKDNEVDGIDWLFIDFDPKRPSGISSTQEELVAATALADKVYQYLATLGFEEPVRALSGNGCHLLYKLELVNNEANTKLLERCLKALDKIFSTDEVEIDCKNFNSSRICKLYGTLAQKGSNTEERPHRFAKIVGEVRELKHTPKLYLEKLADEIPDEPEKPKKYNAYNPSEFDIEEWLGKYNIRYTTKSDSDSTKYTLNECPFNSNHKAPDSMVFKMPSGAIGFKCLHNSCRTKTWQDLRIMFEPDAYEKDNEEFDKRIEEGWKSHNRTKRLNKQSADIPVWQTAKEIMLEPTPDVEYVKTHIDEIDKKMHGLMKGGTSVWSGLRASAKSTILSQLALNAIDDDHCVLFYSGELTKKRFIKWMMQQAAGKKYIKEFDKDGSKYLYVPNNIQTMIADWMSDRFYLYNNTVGPEFERFCENLKEALATHLPDLVVLDNLMMFDIQALDNNMYEAQKKFMQRITELAKEFNVHIAVVAHPRKSVNFLRLIDISGSGNIANLVDSAFIVHRVNHDFRKGYKEEFMAGNKNTEDDVDAEFFHATNVIEVAKDREEGIQDLFIPLFYETRTRRLDARGADEYMYKWTCSLPKESEFEDVKEGESPFEN